ncbi:tetratricopeptide repeat-containing sensor histidine kinase [Polaribacter aestuariivivens]|uniref:tetratricopeptide repeat-containing sensor histidine kinase n=1 Tax=Polaribacter aestuariivivens TaxID=2304626 RepID=UPI003F491515
MNIKKYSLCIFIFISITTFCFSQESSNSELDVYIQKAKKAIANNKADSVTYYSTKIETININKENYKKYISFLSELGHFYEGSGAFEKSLNTYQKGEKIAINFKDYQYLSRMQIDMSQTYRIFHDYKKAIKYGKKASSTLQKDSTKNLISIINALDITAAAFTENGQPDSAAVRQEKILSFLPDLDSTDVRTTFVNLGYTYMELGKLEKSRELTEIGLKLYKPYKSDYANGAIFTNLAMYGNRANKLNYSLRMFDSAIYYTEKSKYIENLVWIYDERAQVYKKMGNLKAALKDTESLVKIKDSIFKKQRDQTVQETEAKYETAKKEKEIAQQKEQLLEKELALKNRNLYAILLASALLILGIIFFAAYKRNQLKKKQLQKEIDLKDALSTIKTQNRLQEQRLRISRDLHDNIGSQLTFIISSIDNLKFVTKDANEKLKEKLSGISSFTSETIHQLRDTIWAMNKNEVSVEDLHTRILSYIEKAKSATQNIEFKINYDIDKNTSFTSLVGMNMFRVVQEAINNAIKYAAASKIEIKLDKKENQFLISVIDNGVGFDINNVQLGNGLSNMEKRMSEINGKVIINTTKKQGTEIKISCAL